MTLDGRRQALSEWFSVDEIETIETARQAVDPAAATIVYGVYENPFAKSGGIFAVAANYSAELKRQGRRGLVLTPFHVGLSTVPSGSDVREVGTCKVPFDGVEHEVGLYLHVRDDVRWILVRTPGFFNADGGESGTDPYVYTDAAGLADAADPDAPDRLLLDSLFFSASVPFVLEALGHRDNLVVHVQDWELAAVALTVKLAILDGVLNSAAVVLTMHNPYDHGLDDADLRRLTDRPLPAGDSRDTVYQHMIPLTDAPVTTVSDTFARELLDDPLQTVHFADHLQEVLSGHGVVGVDNGLFGKPEPAFSARSITETVNGFPARILKEKAYKREEMLEALADYDDERILGRLTGDGGRPLTELREEVPVFMMFGRFDPGQKGFDVLVRAIEALPRGFGRFIVTPIVAGAPEAYRDDLQELAAARPGEVAIYPFRMEQGYMEAMRGATYAVMPSLYEPFGGATEPYLAGTPVIARGTGGLVQQVVDIHEDPRRGTGLLYREAPTRSAIEWRRLEMAASPHERMAVPVYRSMVTALAEAMRRATKLYREEPAIYARMLANLIEPVQAFTWQRALDEYFRVYEAAASRQETLAT